MGRATARCGWYLRVLVPGDVPADGAITLAEQHPGGLTGAAAHAALQGLMLKVSAGLAQGLVAAGAGQSVTAHPSLEPGG
jgi:MOSC domain-containing protein YiiM